MQLRPGPGPGGGFFPPAEVDAANPKIAINVITAMTDEGRKAPQPDPNKPLYYNTQPAGYVQLGHSTAAEKKP